MGEWKPHGSDLVVAGRARIHQATGDIEMGFRITVIERPAIALDVDGRGDADRGQRNDDAECD